MPYAKKWEVISNCTFTLPYMHDKVASTFPKGSTDCIRRLFTKKKDVVQAPAPVRPWISNHCTTAPKPYHANLAAASGREMPFTKKWQVIGGSGGHVTFIK